MLVLERVGLRRACEELCQRLRVWCSVETSLDACGIMHMCLFMHVYMCVLVLKFLIMLFLLYVCLYQGRRLGC